MKTTVKIFFSLLLIAFVSTACSKLDVEVAADFKANMPVSIAADATPDSVTTTKNTNQDWYYFGVSDTLDPNDNADYKKYADKIKEINITSITATIRNPNKAFDLGFLYIEVKDLNTNTFVYWSWGLSQVVDGTTFTFDDTGGKFAEVKAMFLAGHKVETYCGGYASERGITFSIETIYGTKIIANPLN